MVKQWLLAAVVIGGVLLPATAFARPWRDQKGNVINADFVKIEGGMIYLKPENKYAAATPFPFYDFSEADQEFVRAILKKKGQEDRIPPRPKDDPNKPGQPGVGGVPVTIVPNAAPIATGIPDSPPVNGNPMPAVPIAVTPTVPPTFIPTPTPTNVPVPNSQYPASNTPNSSHPNLFPRPAPPPPFKSPSVAFLDEISKPLEDPKSGSANKDVDFMEESPRLFGVLFLLSGLFGLWGSATDNDWFMSHRKARGLISLVGRDGARIIYGIMGVGFTVLGTLVALGIVVLRNSR
ncbi:MAG: Imm17 family immunity protein [Planctomycetaceae bacterium]